MNQVYLNWFEVWSDLFINLSAGWLTLVFIEPRISQKIDFFGLTTRFFFGIFSLLIAKFLKDRAKNL